MDANRQNISARLRAFGYALSVCFILTAPIRAEDDELSVFNDEVFSEPFASDSAEQHPFCDPSAARFEAWDGTFETTSDGAWEDVELRPFDWVRHFGFRHSSSHGRHVGRGIPMEGTSWKNRPYHVDWFIGSLIGDELIRDRVSQDNELLGGFRLGWDFDYYWGLEWRFAWSDPNIQFADTATTPANGSIFMSDVDLVYYPWGDSKIRPYGLIGAGFARYEFLDDTAISRHTSLVTMPVGGGIQFHQWKWLVWRLEALDNISFGADGLDTQHSISLTAGMELRFGARPESYWPWRSSRRVW